MSSVAFYISGHGFGHASRQVEVINALGSVAPAVRILVRTSAPRWLFDRTVQVPFTFVDGECDTGIVQLDSLRMDEAASIARAAAFYDTFPQRVAREAALLREHRASLVVADAPPLACAAAAAAGAPAVVGGNFTWDWIYEGFADHLSSAPNLLPIIRDAYRNASEAWRLPMHGGFQTFDRIVDIPYIARHARHARSHVRAALGLASDRPLALSSFGGYGLDGFDPSRLDCLDTVGVVITGRTGPPALPRGVHFVDERRIYDAGLRYEDLVAAVDVVVTKPGYGIISECIANTTAVLYTSRGRFREYDVMVAEMPRVLRCEFIANDHLLAGRWRKPLIRVLEQPQPPESPPTDGAATTARMIAERLG